jgi:hypothetical protein
VVKEIESPEPKPSENLIHHPDELDGVFTGDWMADLSGRQSRSPSRQAGWSPRHAAQPLRLAIMFRWIRISEPTGYSVVPAAIRSKPSVPSRQNPATRIITAVPAGWFAAKWRCGTTCRGPGVANRALHLLPAAVIVYRIHRPPRQVGLVVMSIAVPAFGVE